MTVEQALAISKALSTNPKYRSAEERLRAKCRWEAMSRSAVIVEWGDPRNWETT